MNAMILLAVIGLDAADYYSPPVASDYCKPSIETLVIQALPPAPAKAQKPVARVEAVVTYPIRGNHWTYPGHNRAELIHHLMTDGIHRGQFQQAYLESLNYQQLLSLHDDHHEGRVKRQAVKQPRPVSFVIRGVVGCPNGRCPK